MDRDLFRRVGFFRELPGGYPDDPSVHQARDGVPRELRARICAYLAGGSAFWVSSAPVTDIISGRQAVGRVGSRTDGEWTWPTFLPYFVEEYGVALDPEFLAAMASRNWCPVDLGRDRLLALMCERRGE